MSAFVQWIIPIVLLLSGAACFKGTDVYDALTSGAEEGLRVVMRMAVTLVPLLTAVSMLRASGALDALSAAAAPFMSAIGIPEACAPLMLLRPVSGGGALAAGTEIIKTQGVDSFAGRVTAVVLASTETTIYTATLYFGAAKIKKTGFVIPAALTADFFAFVFAALTVRLFMM